MSYWSCEKIDLTGRRFGRWTVLSEAPPDRNGNPRWNCVCDCGTKKEVYGHKLRDGVSKSCGCLRKELKTKHGYCGTHIYRVWRMMMNQNSVRGIEVHEEWKKDAGAFAEWAIENGIGEGKHFLRYDTRKGFTPENCHFSDNPNQAQGRKSRHFITLDGETHSAAEWARITGIPYQTIMGRIAVGRTPEEILRK